MIRLGADACQELVIAAQLHKALPTVLAPFEVELLWELTERCLGQDQLAVATADEWRIVEDCLVSLRAELAKCRMSIEGVTVRWVEVA